MRRKCNFYLTLIVSVVFFMNSCGGDSPTNENNNTNETENSLSNTDNETTTNETENIQNNETLDKNQKKNNQPASEEAFPQLTRLRVEGNTIGYLEGEATVINKSFNEVKSTYPSLVGDGVVLLKTKISPSSSMEYLVVYSPGPSADPEFIFYDAANPGQPLFQIGGLSLYIPENGNIYVDGHTNNMFNKRQKFKVNNGTFTETKQPYYYVGLKTQSAKALKLYDSDKGGNVIANIPAGYEIEVLVTPYSSNYMVESCLIKTEFGLTGWIHLGDNQMYGNEDIKGFYYAGD